MKKPYRIMKVCEGGFGYVAFSVDHSRPEDYLPKMEQELARKGYEGQVLFDLLMCNGPTRNRYMLARFDGEKFAVPSWRMSEPEEIPVMSKATAPYWGKMGCLGDGVLTHAQQASMTRAIASSHRTPRTSANTVQHGTHHLVHA